MKKLLLISVLLLATVVSVHSQRNVILWKNDKSVVIESTADVDYISFDGSGLFNITTSKPAEVGDDYFTGTASVSLTDKVSSVSGTELEVGICYSDYNVTPVYSNGHYKLGTELKEYSFKVPYLDNGTTFYYRAYVKVNSECYYDSKVYTATTTGITPSYVILYRHKFVDLGLPSGLLWSACNLGASQIQDDGDYFAWGETETKKTYTTENYKFGESTYSKYNDDDNLTTLEAEDDAATVIWGSRFRMPTDSEFYELFAKCEWHWNDSYRGTSGYMVTGPNGNQIFLPCAGRYTDELVDHGESGAYWASTIYPQKNTNSYFFRIYSGVYFLQSKVRCIGLTIRPVAAKVQ